MGRKYAAGARRLSHTGGAKLLIYLCVGVAVGMLGGYTLMGELVDMRNGRGTAPPGALAPHLFPPGAPTDLAPPGAGTAHAILETRGNQHFSKDKAAVAKPDKPAKGAVKGGGAASDAVHTLCTSNGSPYQSAPRQPLAALPWSA